VKVLDFGLAKAFAGDDGLDLSHALTLTVMGTEEGLRASWPGMASRKTYAIPLRLPKLPSSGIRSEGDLLALPGVQAIDQANAFPGRDPLVYTFIRTTTQRNLYRAQLP
jgi:hypothetical protein